MIRLRAPREGEVAVDDAVQGRVTWAADQLDDLILLRSDGTPVYMLAVVVDDHDMGVKRPISAIASPDRSFCAFSSGSSGRWVSR
ncbi:MAG: glutamate--tRNA ligase family protein [Pseudomonadota bacterium]